MFTLIPKRKRKKYRSMVYRGILIQQSGCYTAPYDRLRVMAFLPDVEQYFKSVGKVKQYIDKHFKEIKALQERTFDIFETAIISDPGYLY